LAVIYLLPHSSGTLAISAPGTAEDTAQRLAQVRHARQGGHRDVSESSRCSAAYGEHSLTSLGIHFDRTERLYREQERVGAARSFTIRAASGSRTQRQIRTCAGTTMRACGGVAIVGRARGFAAGVQAYA